MVVELPEQFLKWNYYPRRDYAKQFLKGKQEQNINKFFLDSTRHNPALCTAYQRDDGSIFVNAKIVGVGYVLKRERLAKALAAFKQHLENGDKLFAEKMSKNEQDKATMEYHRETMTLLVEQLYLPPQNGKAFIDFTKMSTMELAKSKPWSSKHTWNTVQKNRSACLLFYRPPNLSFELHGWIDIHTQGLYYEFVNAVHDSFHYASPEKRQTERPVYIFNVEEVYDNSPTPNAYGLKIA